MTGLHNRKVITGLAVCLLTFVGCGGTKIPETVENNSIIINGDGTVTSHVVGVFDKDYYDLDGLRKMAQEEAASYNTANQQGDVTPVVVERVEALPNDDGSVIVTYLYDKPETYADCNGVRLFYGTVEEAGQAGYDFEALNQVLFDTKGKKSILSADLKNMAKKHVILFEEQTRVYCPSKVAYISENAKVTEDGSIDAAGVFPEEYPVIIVLEK